MPITISMQLQIMDKLFEDAYAKNPHQFTRGSLVALQNRMETIASGIRGVPAPIVQRQKCAFCRLRIRGDKYGHLSGMHHRRKSR